MTIKAGSSETNLRDYMVFHPKRQFVYEETVRFKNYAIG